LQGLERGQSEIFRRLRIVDRLDERTAAMDRAVANCDRNCEAIRQYVDAELAKQEEAEREKRRLSQTEKIAIWGGGFLLLATFISAIASLIAAGAFG
jgi:hypothetical protein